MFTKEDKDQDHFQRLRDTIVVPPDPRIPITEEPMQLQADNFHGEMGSTNIRQNQKEHIESNTKPFSKNISVPTSQTNRQTSRLKENAFNIKTTIEQQQSKNDLTHNRNQNVNAKFNDIFTSIKRKLINKSTKTSETTSTKQHKSLI